MWIEIEDRVGRIGIVQDEDISAFMPHGENTKLYMNSGKIIVAMGHPKVVFSKMKALWSATPMFKNERMNHGH